MNWELVKWVAGVAITLGSIKFALRLIRKIFSKDSMDSMLRRAGNSINDAAERSSDFVSEKIKQSREKRMQQKANQKPEITIW